MTRTQRNQTRTQWNQPPTREATVVHDGCAFQLAADLRRVGFQVKEGPLFSSSRVHEEPGTLAVLATRPGSTRSQRLREWARQLCGKGAAVLAVGAAMSPVAELFGSAPAVPRDQQVGGRLADVRSASQGLFSGLPSEFRMALPAGNRLDASELSAEFSTTAWSKDGELIGASHVFRPVHLLHSAALENKETSPTVLDNLLRLLRERGGRAF